MEHKWKPGHYGKGFWLNNGEIHTWTTQGTDYYDENDGEPIHYDYAVNHLGIATEPRADFYKRYDDVIRTSFWMDPNGRMQYSHHPSEPWHPNFIHAVQQAHPDLKDAQADKWTFEGALQAELGEPEAIGPRTENAFRPWKPGIRGKAIVGPNGEAFMWANHDYSSPHHWPAARMKGWEPRELMGEFFIYPDGTVAAGGSHNKPGAQEALLKQYPELKSVWDLGMSQAVRKYVDEKPSQRASGHLERSPYVDELKEFLDSVTPQEPEPLTPHHDSPDQIVQQPGLLSKIKRRLSRNPRLVQQTSPRIVAPPPSEDKKNFHSDEWEWLKNEWADRDDGKGSPLEYPYDPPPLRTDHHSPNPEHASSNQTQPIVQWHGENPKMVGDHSFIYHVPTNTIHIGSPELHHHDIQKATGLDIWGQHMDETMIGSIYDQNVNMDTSVSADWRNHIAQGLGLPTDEDWAFDPDYWKHSNAISFNVSDPDRRRISPSAVRTRSKVHLDSGRGDKRSDMPLTHAKVGHIVECGEGVTVSASQRNGWHRHPLPPWEPGQYGKGILWNDGELQVWRVTHEFGGPHHADLEYDDPRGIITYLTIQPDGNTEMYDGGATEDGDIGQYWPAILKQEPRLNLSRLHQNLVDDWAFGG